MIADPRQAAQIEECKRTYTPEIIAKIADDDLPECFELQRVAYVALAQLLMDALHQIANSVSDRSAIDAALEKAKAKRDAAVEALKVSQRLIDEALPRFNWGASALDANAIQLLNEVPGQIRAVLREIEGES